ncbi:hypothetical protein KY358_06885 [Candidatus Woesearchaeota archaeon]|nr:hypothetical protein [Candidatus Woesearchaeota archaeon]
MVLVFVLFAGLASAASWVNDPSTCPKSDPDFLGVLCSYDSFMCGGSCYSGVISPPSAAAESSTVYYSGLGGGYILDCFSIDGAEPYCDNNGNVWCNADPGCTAVHRLTQCTADAWETSQCSGCISGYQSCDGPYTDANGCEIRTYVTSYGEPNVVYIDGCDYDCIGDYEDCDGDMGEGGNGCEILDGGPCMIGEVVGTYEGCKCEGDINSFETGIQIKYSSNDPLLWGRQFGDGSIASLSSVTGGIFGIDNSGKVGIGTITPQAYLDVDGTIRMQDFLSCTALETDESGNLVCGADATGVGEEEDPVFAAWDKRAGILITESQITDLEHFENADETDPTVTLAKLRSLVTNDFHNLGGADAVLTDVDIFSMGYIKNAGEADPTVAASVKDGVSWTEVANRPAGLDDGDDNTDCSVGGSCALITYDSETSGWDKTQGDDLLMSTSFGGDVSGTYNAIDITLNTGSGMQSDAGGLSLVRSCGANQLLKWNDMLSQWYCAEDSGVGAETDPVFTAWGKSWSDITGVPAGFADDVDNVDDADADPANEMQTLGVSGNTITLTGSASVTAPYAATAGSVAWTGVSGKPANLDEDSTDDVTKASLQSDLTGLTPNLGNTVVTGNLRVTSQLLLDSGEIIPTSAVSIAGDNLPSIDASFDLGSTELKWKDGYFSGTVGAATLSGDLSCAGCVASTDIADGTITGADIANEAVASTEIADGTITGADIADNTLTGGNIADGTITGADIADGTIGAADLADDVEGAESRCGPSQYLTGDGQCRYVGADSRSVFAGKTSTNYNGLMISGILKGYAAANALCDADFPGSHICRADEILDTITYEDFESIPGWDGSGWVAGGPPGYTAYANDCLGFTTSASNDGGSPPNPYLGRAWYFNYGGSPAGSGWLVTCNSQIPITCCRLP